ncbi:MAG: aldehyde dehydrogenase family protein, partial [Proteobacteria bacterium]|nr:aldehyde dehydrogenase family protein [Pseudomonadota bacterium]
RNAVIIAPSPAGGPATAMTVEMIRAELERAGHPADLVQILPPPASKDLTQALMEAADLVVATGSADNVRRSYQSGTPAIGVGAGNVPSIIDASADLADAAGKIRISKTFDNATSCSSENSVIVLDGVYDDAIAALVKAGGYMATKAEKQLIADVLWRNGRLNRQLIAKDAKLFAETVGLSDAARGAAFFMVEETGTGADYPFSGEKLSLVLTVYRAPDFDGAVALAKDILAYQGRGHSCSIHTRDMDHGRRLAEELDVVRVLVNQIHAFGNGGGFDNGLNFTLSMGCGTWAGNSISENLNYRHFINVTHLSTVIPEDRPDEDELFGPYISRHGA